MTTSDINTVHEVLEKELEEAKKDMDFLGKSMDWFQKDATTHEGIREKYQIAVEHYKKIYDAKEAFDSYEWR